MKAKVYIPIIVGAGAVAGMILGLSNIGIRVEKKADENRIEVAQETTTSKPVETKKESESDKKKEEEKKKAEEERKKAEEEKKKAEEEKKKAEEEKKKKEEEAQKESENRETAQQENNGGGTAENREPEYEYIYVPVNDPQYGNTDHYPSDEVQHTHTWEAVYRTVHHAAQTHNEKRYAGTAEYTECRRYGQVVFTLTTQYGESAFYQICRLANGNVLFSTNRESDKQEVGYFTSLLSIPAEDDSYVFSTKVEELYNDVTVTDREAYDEKVVDHYVCISCGQESY